MGHLGRFSPMVSAEFGEVLTPDGQVIDPLSLNILGALAPPAPDALVSVLPDEGVGRVFGGAYGSFNFVNATAYAFDPDHYRSLASLSVPEPYGTVGILPPLIRWGRDGIAFQSAPGFFGQPRLYSVESSSFVLPHPTSENPTPVLVSLAPATVSLSPPDRLICGSLSEARISSAAPWLNWTRAIAKRYSLATIS